MEQSFSEPRRKAVPPEETIRRIRGILSDCNLFVVETMFPVQNGAYSCRLELGDPPLFGRGFGVNGKGMSPRYALASAYGELMERLSSGTLMPCCPFDEADAVAMSVQAFAAQCPDAFLRALKVCSKEELADFLRDCFEDEPLMCAPFRCLNDGSEALLPIELVRMLCGTTGLCAGNTPEEAMLQGLMEVFERYAVKKLYQYQLTPPEISADEFAGTQVLERLEAGGLQYSIRDLSLGKGYPVLALALWRSGGERALHLGAAASREVALERCLTELYQGNADAVRRRFHRPGALNGQDETAVAWAYMAMVTDGSGAFPDRVFDGPASYPANAAGTPCASDAQALSTYVELVRERGSAVYVRDHSALGFPVYRVYVPGASETFLHFPLSRAEFAAWVRLRRASAIVYNLPGASGESLEKLANAVMGLKQARIPVCSAPLERLADRSTPGAGAHEGAFEALLMASAGQYAQAARAMDAFLATGTAHRTPMRLYKAYRALWRALASGATKESALAECEKVYGASLATRCRAAHSTPSGLFDPRIWPQCPNCGVCALAPYCIRNAITCTWDSVRGRSSRFRP